jgi:7-carboxy-7-deazaguanine synthase
MEVIDLFTSISGEVGVTIKQGEQCTFIRFFGCPVACTYCDTPESWKPGSKFKDYSVKEIVRAIEDKGFPKVIVTGGEPLMQKDIAEFLAMLAVSEHIDEIVVETAGVMPPFSVRVNEGSDEDKISYAVDYKLPSAKSAYPGNNMFPYQCLGVYDLIKFLIFTEEDLTLSIEYVENYIALGLDENPVFVFTPAGVSTMVFMETLLKAKLPIIVNVQIHKILGVE